MSEQDCKDPRDVRIGDFVRFQDHVNPLLFLEGTIKEYSARFFSIEGDVNRRQWADWKVLLISRDITDEKPSLHPTQQKWLSVKVGDIVRFTRMDGDRHKTEVKGRVRQITSDEDRNQDSFVEIFVDGLSRRFVNHESNWKLEIVERCKVIPTEPGLYVSASNKGPLAEVPVYRMSRWGGWVAINTISPNARTITPSKVHSELPGDLIPLGLKEKSC